MAPNCLVLLLRVYLINVYQSTGFIAQKCQKIITNIVDDSLSDDFQHFHFNAMPIMKGA